MGNWSKPGKEDILAVDQDGKRMGFSCCNIGLSICTSICSSICSSNSTSIRSSICSVQQISICAAGHLITRFRLPYCGCPTWDLAQLRVASPEGLFVFVSMFVFKFQIKSLFCSLRLITHFAMTVTLSDPCTHLILRTAFYLVLNICYFIFF